MFYRKKQLTCHTCKKEVRNNEQLALFVRANELSGVTNLKAFARLHRVQCMDCVTDSQRRA